jgi:hypothetical protein
VHLAELQPLADVWGVFGGGQKGRPAGRKVQHPGGDRLLTAGRPEPETESRRPTSFAAPFRLHC